MNAPGSHPSAVAKHLYLVQFAFDLLHVLHESELLLVRFRLQVVILRLQNLPLGQQRRQHGVPLVLASGPLLSLSSSAGHPFALPGSPLPCLLPPEPQLSQLCTVI